MISLEQLHACGLNALFDYYKQAYSLDLQMGDGRRVMFRPFDSFVLNLTQLEAQGTLYTATKNVHNGRLQGQYLTACTSG